MKPRPPTHSYVVWHTQRTGSSLLCTTLDATGVAGHPEEWPDGLLEDDAADFTRLRDELWTRQTTSNGVLGVKFSYQRRGVERFFDLFSRPADGDRPSERETWESVFPNCRHVVMTRRNTFRLAVSWWKSIKGGPGHLSRDGSRLPWQTVIPSVPTDLMDSYDFDAIRNLVMESVEREAGIQELLFELDASPIAVTYEDFVDNYEPTVRGVLRHLGLEREVQEIPPPLLARTSDHINEEWLRQFLHDIEIHR